MSTKYKVVYLNIIDVNGELRVASITHEPSPASPDCPHPLVGRIAVEISPSNLSHVYPTTKHEQIEDKVVF